MKASPWDYFAYYGHEAILYAPDALIIGGAAFYIYRREIEKYFEEHVFN